MQRKELTPPLEGKVQWPGVFEGYARKWVSRHFWRVRASLGSEEDALQECALIYVRCYNYYKWKVDNAAWFMSLYKLALVNDWNTLSVADSRFRATVPPPSVDTIEPPSGMLAARLHSASDELKHVLSVISEAPAELLGMMLGSTSERINNRTLCRWSGIRHGEANILGELRDLLTT